MKIADLYKELFSLYGPQGWWPVEREITVPHSAGYHPGDYNTPTTPEGVFEVVLGAILTQNTAFTQVRTALTRLRELEVHAPEALISLQADVLEKAIKPTGYFRMKARKLNEVCRYFIERGPDPFREAPKRESLLSVWGIGPETADSILLYGFHQREFVIDAYTNRLFSRIGLFKRGEEKSYNLAKICITEAIPKDIQVYKEFHALIVQHCKISCKKTPACKECAFNGFCLYPGNHT